MANLIIVSPPEKGYLRRSRKCNQSRRKATGSLRLSPSSPQENAVRTLVCTEIHFPKVTKEYFLFWPDEPMFENLRSAYVNLERETHTNFSICLPNLRDYYHVEAEDAKEMIDI